MILDGFYLPRFFPPLSLAALSSPGSSLYHFPRLWQPTAPFQRLPRSKYVGG